MGECEFEQKAVVKAVDSALQAQAQERLAEDLRLSTPGGRFQVRWDENGSATALGQLGFFAEFLEVSGVFARWMEGCPMSYTSPNAPAVVDVLGTWLLSILDGQRRYAHVAGLRGDEVAPQILGMNKIVSDESLRRALAHLAPNQPKRCSDEERAARAAQLVKSTAWMDAALDESTSEALSTDWILDVDTTVKLLFGHQDGAEIGYNPTRPGRPSHTLHTYWIGNIRMVLDVEVQSGKAGAAKHSLPRLRLLIERLPPDKRPIMVRGDNAFGNERVMLEMEEIGQRYLFKLRQTAGVKRMIKQQWKEGEWVNVGQGFDAVESTLQLTGWSRSRRVVVLRRRVKGSLAVETNDENPQQTLNFIDSAEKVKLWEYAVLVTNADYPLEAMGQLYRDRADCENGFDELKNQWGWGGYTSRRLASSSLMANLIALFYNWWSLYLRFYDEGHHREAIRTRPMLMSGVGRQVQSGGQRTVKVSVLHERGDLIAHAVTLISKELQDIRAITERWSVTQRWTLLLTRVLRRWLGGKWLPDLPADAKLLLSG